MQLPAKWGCCLVLPAVQAQSDPSKSDSIGIQAKVRQPRQSFASLAPPRPNFTTLKLPAKKGARQGSTKMRLAQSIAPLNGLVLDYNLTGSQTNFTFQSDTTYFVTNTVNLYGTCTFEGGTVVKFATNSSASLVISGVSNLVCLTPAYRPVIFTAQDDNTVGSAMSGSTGIPTGYYGGTGLVSQPYGGPTVGVNNFRFSYLRTAADLDYGTYNLYNCQLINCGVGFHLDTTWFYLGNALLANVATNFYCVPDPCTVALENITTDCAGSSNRFCTLAGYESYPWDNVGGDGPDFSMSIANSLIYDLGDNKMGLYAQVGTDPLVTMTNNGFPYGTVFPIFQTVGAAGYYLTDGSSYRDAGSTNINTNLLAYLRQKTTYPPIVFAGMYYTNSSTLFPQAQRDYGANPDLGYHYDPIDFAFGAVLMTNATLTVTPGTVIAGFNTNGDGYGLAVCTGAQLLCQGRPPVFVGSSSTIRFRRSPSPTGVHRRPV